MIRISFHGMIISGLVWLACMLISNVELWRTTLGSILLSTAILLAIYFVEKDKSEDDK